MSRKPLLAAVRDALAQASNLLAAHSNSGRGEIRNAQEKISDAKTEVEEFIEKNGDEEYEDVRW
ncbi:MAG: hypothetical protein HC899_14560 [Leptolyngbyaceae cyanobacterium SM1_4_3]|nr:hypothetical protein [Leptolyngbyaceae cyanobacterium SM1_4_3]NJN89222.1 hypothetical protein [Leptolyngbyaceae cyanobacterium SL_5_14]